jgi:hypothetical protein
MVGRKKGAKRMRQEAVFFPCGEIKLSGYCYYPDKSGVLPGVVICHPHPQNGGSMSNNVIRILGLELVERSVVTLMFNFRGVGKSQGSFDSGIGEQDDAIAAINWLETQLPVDKQRIGIAGYSFGGGVAAKIASRDARVKSVALISPYLEPVFTSILQKCSKPKYFITGDEDDLIPPENVKSVFDLSAEPKQLELIPGVDHFWAGHEKKLAQKVADFLMGVLN